MIALRAIGAIVLVAVGASPLLALGTVTMRVDPATRAVPVNGTFTVDIVADNVSTEMSPDGLGAYEFDVTYDKDYLEVVTGGVADAGELDDTGRTVVELGPTINNPDGRTTFAAYSNPPLDANGPVSPTVVLATVTLKAKRAGVTTLDLENGLLTDTQANAWPDGGERNLQVTGGEIKLHSFWDMEPWHWAWRDVEAIYSVGVTGGCAWNPLRFCPDDTVTRAQMAKFLVSALGETSLDRPSSFADVPDWHWGRPWIERLYDLGITGGCAWDPLRFCPEYLVTRAQMAAFLRRAFDIPYPF